jgi:phosphate/sulfate permease
MDEDKEEEAADRRRGCGCCLLIILVPLSWIAIAVATAIGFSDGGKGAGPLLGILDTFLCALLWGGLWAIWRGAHWIHDALQPKSKDDDWRRRH